MDRSGWITAGAAALIAFAIGKGMGPAQIGFPDPEDARSADEMEKAVAKALAEPRAFPREGALIRLYEGLSQENVTGALAAVNARSGEYDPVDLQLLLGAWAHLDPASAIQTVETWPIRSRRELGIRIVMREWAASGRQIEAGAYFDSLTDPDKRDLAAGPLVRGWALSGDTEGALALALRFWQADGGRDVIDALVRGVLQAKGARGTFELAGRLDPEKQGEFAQRVSVTALNLAGREDPRAAAAHFDALFARTPNAAWLASAIPRIAGLLRNESPREALEWARAKPESADRNRGLLESSASWARQDFEGAWRWFEENVTAARSATAELSPADSAIAAGLVRRMARIRPAEAAPWALRLRPGADRIEMLRRVAYFWSAVDPARADAWIASLTIADDERARILEAANWGRSQTSEPTGSAEPVESGEDD